MSEEICCYCKHYEALDFDCGKCKIAVLDIVSFDNECHVGKFENEEGEINKCK